MKRTKGTAIHCSSLALAIFGLGFCVVLPRLDAQTLGHATPAATDRAGLAGATSPELVKGQFAANIPKNMRLNASALVRVSIWDKTAAAQARAMLEAGPVVATDVRVGRLLCCKSS